MTVIRNVKTASHFPLRCPHYEEIRNKLQNVVDDSWISAKCKGHLHLSDNLLLAPHKLIAFASQKEWADILNLHSFQFIRSASRNIWSSLTFIIVTTYILVKIVTIVVTTPVLILQCLHFGGSSQHVASLSTVILLLELIPGVTRPSTDINNNNILFLLLKSVSILYNHTEQQPRSSWNRCVIEYQTQH